jgi:hypothetical protein
MSALSRGYQAMTAEVGAGTARLRVFLVALDVCAFFFGMACLAGVRQSDTMLESGQAQRAFDAVKRHAGSRMQVRDLEITPGNDGLGHGPGHVPLAHDARVAPAQRQILFRP